MPYTPARKGSGRPWSSSSKSSPKASKGLFIDNVWHCNCEPRLPASHFQVRKDGANKGRWFYTCQEPKESGCGFFLWDTDAAGREMKTVIANIRSEPEVNTRASPGAAGSRSVNSKLTIEGHKEASNRWLANLGNSGEDEFGVWPLSAGEEDTFLSQVAPASSFTSTSTLPNSPETPRKVARIDLTMTPGSKRKRDDDMLPTPQTYGTVDIFDSPSISRSLGNTVRKLQFVASPTPTPISQRLHNTSVPPLAEPADAEITLEVLAFLESCKLAADVADNIRDLLNKYAMRTAGIEKGRDIVRTALRGKDTKIAELHTKIAALENEKEMDRRVIQNLKEAFKKTSNG